MVDVQGLVVDVRPFGCFMEFDVEAESGSKHKVYGMVHVSEVSWDYCIDARERVQVEFLRMKILSWLALACRAVACLFLL